MVMHLYLDPQAMTRKEEVIPYLKEMLFLPESCGNNLDALYDALTELPWPVCVHLPSAKELESLGVYAESVRKTLKDAAAKNPNFTIE